MLLDNHYNELWSPSNKVYSVPFVPVDAMVQSEQSVYLVRTLFAQIEWLRTLFCHHMDTVS